MKRQGHIFSISQWATAATKTHVIQCLLQMEDVGRKTELSTQTLSVHVKTPSSHLEKLYFCRILLWCTFFKNERKGESTK